METLNETWNSDRWPARPIEQISYKNIYSELGLLIDYSKRNTNALFDRLIRKRTAKSFCEIYGEPSVNPNADTKDMITVEIAKRHKMSVLTQDDADRLLDDVCSFDS